MNRIIVILIICAVCFSYTEYRVRNVIRVKREEGVWVCMRTRFLFEKIPEMEKNIAKLQNNEHIRDEWLYNENKPEQRMAYNKLFKGE